MELKEDGVYKLPGADGLIIAAKTDSVIADADSSAEYKRSYSRWNSQIQRVCSVAELSAALDKILEEKNAN